jgi:hypothetical protein
MVRPLMIRQKDKKGLVHPEKSYQTLIHNGCLAKQLFPKICGIFLISGSFKLQSYLKTTAYRSMENCIDFSSFGR